MGEKGMVDFPGFITRDSETRHLLVGDDSHVLLSNTIIAELHRQLFASLGFEETARIIYESAKKGTYEVQKNLIEAYGVTLKDEEDFRNRISMSPRYIQTYGHGRGKTLKRRREFVFEVRDSAVAQYLKDSQLGRPVCHFLAGFFAGMAEAYAELIKPSSSYSCVETKCIAIGDPYCEFRLSSQQSK
ncbi:V4R domain-containing protein [Chloroflexota bacterium]